MPDDEPLDDLRAVAMTAGAAAARVVENVVRDAQNRAQQQTHQQQQATVDAQRRQAAAHTALATGQTLTGTPYDSPLRVAPPTDLDQAMTWVMREAPESLKEHETDWANSDTSDGRRSADAALGNEWKIATYDNPERRAATDQAMHRRRARRGPAGENDRRPPQRHRPPAGGPVRSRGTRPTQPRTEGTSKGTRAMRRRDGAAQ